jgi:hypothetical protein
LRDYEGFYQFKNPRNEIGALLTDALNGIWLSIENDTLYYKGFLQDKKMLLPTAYMLFRTAESNFSNAVLTENRQGRLAFQVSGLYYEKTGYAQALLLRVVFFGGMIVALISAVMFLGWLVLLLKRELNFGGFLLRTMSFFAYTFLAIAIYCFQSLFGDDLSGFSEQNAQTLTFYVAMLMFPLLSVLAILFVLFHKHKINKWMQAWLFIAATFACALSYIFYDYGFVGMKLWEY